MKLQDRTSSLAKCMDRYLGIPLVVFCSLTRALGELLWRPLVRFFWNFRKTRSRRSKILVIKLSALGDLAVMLPALHLLKRHFQESEIVFLGGTSNVSFAGYLGIFSRIELFSASTVMDLASESFMMVIDFEQWMRTSAIVSSQMKCPTIVGFKSKGQHRHFVYDHFIDLDFGQHMGENFWDLVREACFQCGRSTEDTFETDKAAVRQFARPILLEGGKNLPGYESGYVVIHPGCGEHGKYREWPVEYWAQMIKRIQKEDPHKPILISGFGNYEREMASKLEGPGVESWVGRLPLDQLFSVLSNADMIYCCNTGIMHIASLLNGKLVALHGPTDPRLWGPLWGGTVVKSILNCSPCLTWGHDYGCSDPVCVRAIGPRTVVEASHA